MYFSILYIITDERGNCFRSVPVENLREKGEGEEGMALWPGDNASLWCVEDQNM